MFGTVISRADGTYVITLNGLPYHVIESDPLYIIVAQYAAEHPESVQQEQPLPELPPAEAASAKRSTINAKRDELEAATPFEYDGSAFDYDEKSRERINAAVSGALIAALNGIDTSAVVATWTLYNNTTRNMTVADWLAFRQAEIVRSGALHATARTLKDAVDAALAAGATAAEIEALPVWTE